MSAAALTSRQRAIIRDILAPYRHRIDRVALFGSRATGRARANSDIDLVLYGDLDEAEVDRLRTSFDESALSVSVDLVAYGPSVYPPLRRHIDETACDLFLRSDLAPG